MSDAIDPSRYDALTFDCYGTLIDWESGLIAFLKPLLERRDVHTIDDWTLGFFGDAEARLEAGPYRPYRDVLGSVLDAFGARLGFTPTASERQAFAESVGDWPPFPDTVDALRNLSRRYRLAVVSNVDDALFARTRARLADVPFADVITAEQVRAYKPDPKPFDEAERRLGLAPQRILHVAQSRYHDVAPARARGLDTVWIDRRAHRHGGATKASDVAPTFRFDDLRSLAAALG